MRSSTIVVKGVLRVALLRYLESEDSVLEEKSVLHLSQLQIGAPITAADRC